MLIVPTESFLEPATTEKKDKDQDTSKPKDLKDSKDSSTKDEKSPAETTNKLLMNCEYHRLETFKWWPHPIAFGVKPSALAEAGLYFEPKLDDAKSDLCICFSCQLQLLSWEPHDDPW